MKVVLKDDKECLTYFIWLLINFQVTFRCSNNNNPIKIWLLNLDFRIEIVLKSTIVAKKKERETY